MITLTILVLTIVFSAYAMNRPDLKYKYMFHPYAIYHDKQHYRFLSHAFLHGDYIHLALNMYALLVFGPLVEEQIYPIILGHDGVLNPKMGGVCYIILYTGAIYASSVFEYFKNRHNPSYTSLGASGAINAIMFAFILYAPSTPLGILFIPMPAWVFGIIYLAVSFYLSRKTTGHAATDRIGHEAHFFGAVYGVVFTGILKPELFSNFIHKIIP